jgi:predicted phage terminase large subunit-like protein
MGAPDLNLIRIGPQPGPQTEFVSSEADILIYGGAAGGGKSYGLLLDPLRHYNNKDFGGVIFRKTAVQVRNEGGLWDESMKLYSLFAAKPSESRLSWRFPSGMSMSFSNLEYEKDVLNYQGAQLPYMGFDELTHFSEAQFFYMLSRNRSTCGVRPRIRATCNPDPDSWVRKFIDWWIGDDGYPIKARAGKTRYFIRVNDRLVWADSPRDLHEIYGYGPEVAPKSVCFIPAKLEDNKILMDQDPSYLGTLLALNRVDRLRLKEGNWNVRAQAGMLFQREWFPVIDAIPAGWLQVVRFWDRAATKPNETNKDPDWTRGVKLYKYRDGTYVVGDLVSAQDTPFQIRKLIKTVADNDTVQVKIVSHQDPGSAGVLEAEDFTRLLVGYYVQTYVVPRDVSTGRRDKVTRAKPASAQCEGGNVRVLRATWNDAFFTELENFPEGAHDDIVDAFSGAFNDLSGGLSLADVL